MTHGSYQSVGDDNVTQYWTTERPGDAHPARKHASVDPILVKSCQNRVRKGLHSDFKTGITSNNVNLSGKRAQKWDRLRFHANLDDYRPVLWPPPGPYWCSGEGDDYSIVVAYVPTGFRDLFKFWPEAQNVDALQTNTTLSFSDRFPKPDWWTKLEAASV